jgi:hypothetical protein
MIILSACDQVYLDRAKALIASVIKNTDYHFYLHTFNVEEKIKHPRVTHIQEFVTFKDNEVKRDYLANLRPYLFVKYFGLNRPMLWLDADTIVRGDISGLERMLLDNDTVAVDTPEMLIEENEILISTVGLNTTPEAKALLIEWLIVMESLRNYEHYYSSIMTVQLAYIRALKKLLHIKYKDITYTYSDKFFRDETPLWEAQGDRKHNDKKYLEEENKYRNEFECLIGK